jgi:hypothetical protein
VLRLAAARRVDAADRRRGGPGLHWNEDGFEPPPGYRELLARPDGLRAFWWARGAEIDSQALGCTPPGATCRAAG